MTVAARSQQQAFQGQRLKTWADFGIFFLFFILGGLAIVILRQLGFSFWFFTGIPVGLIFAYLFLTLFLRRFRLIDDQIGDNCYYLDLLYTLISLSYVLYVFVQNEKGPEAIISSFGIALATTIVGLALRVGVNQMRQDPVEVELAARNELADASSRLKSELDAVVRDMNSFRRSTEQAVAEAIEETASRTLEKLTEVVKSFEEVAVGVGVKIDEVIDGFRENANKVNKSSSRIVGSMEKMVERIEEIQPPSDLIQAKLETVVQSIVQLAEQIQAKSEAESKELEGIVTAIQNIGAASGTTAQEMAKISEQVRSTQEVIGEAAKLGSEIASFAETVSKIQGTLSTGAEEQMRNLQRLSSEAGALLEAARRHNQELESELERSRGLVGEVHGSLTSMTRLITEKL